MADEQNPAGVMNVSGNACQQTTADIFRARLSDFYVHFLSETRDISDMLKMMGERLSAAFCQQEDFARCLKQELESDVDVSKLEGVRSELEMLCHAHSTCMLHVISAVARTAVQQGQHLTVCDFRRVVSAPGENFPQFQQNPYFPEPRRVVYPQLTPQPVLNLSPVPNSNQPQGVWVSNSIGQQFYVPPVLAFQPPQQPAFPFTSPVPHPYHYPYPTQCLNPCLQPSHSEKVDKTLSPSRESPRLVYQGFQSPDIDHQAMTEAQEGIQSLPVAPI